MVKITISCLGLDSGTIIFPCMVFPADDKIVDFFTGLVTVPVLEDLT